MILTCPGMQSGLPLHRYSMQAVDCAHDTVMGQQTLVTIWERGLEAMVLMIGVVVTIGRA